MGLFMYLTDDDIQRLRYRLSEVEEDVAILFKEALQFDNSLLIYARTFDVYEKFIFWRYRTNKIHTEYTIYHENNFEAQQMICASGGKEIVKAYLYGIINGVSHQNKIK